MKFFTVHEPPEPQADRIDRASDLLFIGDSFVPAAFVFGPLWLLGKRLWLAFGAYLLAAVVVGLAVVASGLNFRWFSLVISAFNLIVAFEASSLQRWALERSGWRTLGTVSGRTIDECERRFLEGWLFEQQMTGAASDRGTMGTRLATAASSDASGRLGRGTLRSWLPWRTARAG